MKRPWYLHGLVIFIVGNFTCGIGWLVLGILRINWDKKNNDAFLNSLTQNNGDSFTQYVYYEVEKMRNNFGGRLIAIHRNFTDDGYPTRYMCVSVRDNASNIDTDKVRQDGYAVKLLENDSIEISTIIKGYDINGSKLKQYVRHMGSVLKEKYQENGNDIVEVKEDMIVIMPDIKDVAMMIQNK
ncbi:MAG: hypothetical protein IKY23_10300 [Lachnospiraceae bacterium]|nr:hypothetical protein [Lachnospiraceae bacterium]